MRAMEYTPVEPAGHSCDGDWRYWCLACAGDSEPDLTAQKHLTDAECAAEYWRAEADEQINLSTNEDDAGAVDAYRHLRTTWHRFATHPHADEVDQ